MSYSRRCLRLLRGRESRHATFLSPNSIARQRQIHNRAVSLEQDSAMVSKPSGEDTVVCYSKTSVSLNLQQAQLQLVSWCLTSLSSTNIAISETKGQGWRAIPTQYRKASDILTSTLATFLFSSHPKRERHWEAHLNYYASADNRERQPSHHKTKLNK